MITAALDLFTNLLQVSLLGGNLVLALLLLRRTRLWPGLAMAGLCAALLRFLLPLPFMSPLSLYGLFAESEVSTLTITSTAEEAGDGMRYISMTCKPAALHQAPLALFALWALGAVLLMLCFLLLRRRQNRALRLALPLAADDPAAAAVREAAGALGGKIRVYSCEGLLAPLTAGIFRPRILLPSGTADTPALRLSLEHELAHIRGRHNLLKLLAVAACCLHWFNPLVWRLRTLLCQEMELSSDRQALRRLGRDRREDYALALLRFYQRAPSPAFQSAFDGGAVEERIRRIMLYRPGRRGVAALFALLAILLFTALACPPAPLYLGSMSSGTRSVSSADVEAGSAGEYTVTFAREANLLQGTAAEAEASDRTTVHYLAEAVARPGGLDGLRAGEGLPREWVVVEDMPSTAVAEAGAH